MKTAEKPTDTALLRTYQELCQVRDRRALEDLIVRNRLPRLMLATNDFEFGVKITHKKHALFHRNITANHENLACRIVIDCDSDVLAEIQEGPQLFWQKLGIPAPSWSVFNKYRVQNLEEITEKHAKNGRAHIGFELLNPIPTSSAAHEKPLAYLADIERKLINSLKMHGINADLAFSGDMMKNPVPFKKETDRAYFFNMSTGLYTLEQLDELTVGKKPKKIRVPTAEVVGFSRNVHLFDVVRKQAYSMRLHCPSAETMLSELLPIAEGVNRQFKHPLPYSSIKATCKSITRFCFTKMNPVGYVERTHTPEIQRLRALKLGAMRFEGSKTALEPWKAEGISRATWYRRRKAEK
jgi:hypothetical protein